MLTHWQVQQLIEQQPRCGRLTLFLSNTSLQLYIYGIQSTFEPKPVTSTTVIRSLWGIGSGNGKVALMVQLQSAKLV